VSRGDTYFESKAGHYSDRSTRGLWSIIRRAEEIAVLECAGEIAGKKCLDAGCGTGYYTRLLLRHGASHPVTGVDYSAAMVEQYETIIGTRGVVGNLAKLELGESFDLIICAGALEFVPDVPATIQALERHLTARGRLVILAPRRGFLGSIYRLFHACNGMSIPLFSDAELDALTSSAGLKRLSPWHKPWFALVARFAKSDG